MSRSRRPSPVIDRLDRSNAMSNFSFVALVVLASTLAAKAASQRPAPQQSPATAASGSKTVKLCDDKTTVQVSNDAPKTRAEGQKVSDAMMAQWKATNPERN